MSTEAFFSIGGALWPVLGAPFTLVSQLEIRIEPGNVRPEKKA